LEMADSKDRGWTIEVHIEQEFEECLDISWAAVQGARKVSEASVIAADFRSFAVEMVLDRAPAEKIDTKPRHPASDAMVKRINMGMTFRSSIQNMPTARQFLVSVVGTTTSGGQVRSLWAEAATLDPKDRNTELGVLDIMGNPRMSCKHCPCPAYVPMTWSLNSREKMRCRACGCSYTEHAIVQVRDILKAREAKGRKALKRDKVVDLPDEALNWDDRECFLWFRTEGRFHPRNTLGQGHTEHAANKEGREGRKGRVSVVTPTTESRHSFHELLWRCFEAQTWPDKELVVVETYNKAASPFFAALANSDPRVVYVKFKQETGSDWSIGLKRNIGVHMSSGEFVAHFDDDDLYAPVYLTSMIGLLNDSPENLQAVTLSSWFIFNMKSGRWQFCDPIAWGLTQGFDENAHEVKSWSYGYGFSYVFRRKIALDNAYDDINLGEDFNFMSMLRNRKGQRSVLLFHDDFGICLHVQHGGNTSNSIPLREVDRQEALDLDVMELAPVFVNKPLEDKNTVEPMGGLLQEAVPPSTRKRRVLAHLPDAEVTVECAVSATVEELLRLVRAEVDFECGDYCVHRVPPPGQAGEERRDAIAAEALGISFLAERQGAKENLDPSTKSGKQWRRLLDAAKAPVAARERLGLRTQELWLLPPEAPSEGEEELPAGCEPEKCVFVRATCQQANAKEFFASSRTCSVVVGEGATVAQLREVLGDNLPASAKVLAERPGRGIITLKDTDPVPPEVTLTDFKGKHRFYLHLTHRQALVAICAMRNFFKKQKQQRRLDELEAACKNDVVYRAELLRIISEEVYPVIWRRLGIPLDELSPGQMMEEMGRCVWADLQIAEVWFESEWLMRNKTNLAVAWHAVNMHRSSRGMEPLKPAS